MQKKPVLATLTLVIAFAIFLLGSCFSPWQGEKETTISLSLGGEHNGRMTITDDEKELLFYTIWISRPGNDAQEPDGTLGPGEFTMQRSIAPGEWEIKVLAYKALGESICAAGFGSVHAAAGKDNPVTITMHPTYTVTFVVSTDTSNYNFTIEAIRDKPIDNFPFPLNNFPQGQWPANAVHYLHKGPIADNNYGYNLEGWYKDADHTDKWDNEKDTATAETTLYAKWADNSAVIICDMDGNNDLEKAIAYVDENLDSDEYTLVVGNDTGIPPLWISASESVNLTIRGDTAMRTLPDVSVSSEIKLTLANNIAIENLTLIAEANSKPFITIANAWNGSVKQLHLSVIDASASVEDVIGRWKDCKLVAAGSNFNTQKITLGNFIPTDSGNPQNIKTTHYLGYNNPNSDSGWYLLPITGKITINPWGDMNGDIYYSKNGVSPSTQFKPGNTPVILFPPTDTLTIKYTPHSANPSVKWYDPWGNPITVSGNTITINYADYNKGTHQVTIVETIGGVSWSAEISFKVQ